MSRPFLEIKGVKKAFNGRTVLDGIDLDVERGSITTIMGKSGIGKSVLLKCIAGIHRHDGGEILLDGQHCIGPNCGKNSTRLSYLFQQNALFDSMSAADNVALPIVETSRISRREARRRVDRLFEQLELGDVAGKFPAEISGGMQKRVALARALITEPQLILFDEPTTGLDPQRKNSVFTMIAEYRRRFDFTALMVCHDIPEALFVSDRVAWIDGGRIRFVGAPTDLEVATDSELLEFVHHRNGLLSDVAGQRGRSALFAEWPALRRSFDEFVVVTCTTERRRPGSELGLRRFASYQAAVAGVSRLQRARSEIYFLDERHFGFAVGADSAGSVHEQIAACLQPANDAAASDAAAHYVWSARSYPLARLPDPAALWNLVDLPSPATFATPLSA
ncbi:MAG: ATP-binding cassette domain-containing protein [Verrucomicrobia bacterium]|nr:ATP-binding cassette domain-containing protein [Verrucomicrobiota bacterium]